MILFDRVILVILFVFLVLMAHVVSKFEGRITRLETFPEYNKPSKMPARRPRRKW